VRARAVLGGELGLVLGMPVGGQAGTPLRDGQGSGLWCKYVASAEPWRPVCERVKVENQGHERAVQVRGGRVRARPGVEEGVAVVACEVSRLQRASKNGGGELRCVWLLAVPSCA
jgi:hypothetical protein